MGISQSHRFKLLRLVEFSKCMLHVFPFVARIMKGMGQLEACNQLSLKDYVGSLLSSVLMNGQHFCNRQRRKTREKI